MGFTLFKKRSKSQDPRAPSPARPQRTSTFDFSPRSLHTPTFTTPQTSPYLLQDGFESSDSSSSAASSLSSITSSLRITEEPQQVVQRQTLKLLACIDAPPAEHSSGFDCASLPREPFWVEVDLEDNVNCVAMEIEARLGVAGVFDVGCFKASIPRLAHQQAHAYTKTYGQKVDLLTHFPAYNLRDPKQIHASLGEEATAPFGLDVADTTPITIQECWPTDRRTGGDEIISLIVRLSDVDDSGRAPLTALAYFSKPLNSTTSTSSPCSPLPPRTPACEHAIPEPPVAVEVPAKCTVNELKRIILKADGRPVGALEKCVIWSVDMTWNEMISCEAFGGLRDAGMPWPYPPTSNSPVKLADGKEMVATYLPNMISNTNLVSFYIYIDPSITGIMANNVTAFAASADVAAPHFHYPMSIPSTAKMGTPRSTSLTRQASLKGSPSPLTPLLESQRATLPRMKGRARPSTAPVGDMSRLQAPIASFGTRSIRPKTKLGQVTTEVGLGISA